MNSKFKNKFLKISAIVVAVAVVFSTIIYYLPTEKYSWVKTLKESIPQKYKKKFKSTVFAIPELNKKIILMNKEIKDLKVQALLNKSEINLLESQIDGIKIKDVKFEISKKHIPFAKTVNYGDGKPVSYMAKFKDDIIFVAGYGDILFAKPKNFLKDSEPNYKKINNNLRKKITDDAFWDLDSSIIVKDKTGWNNNLSNGVSVKGILLHDENLYIAYLREIKERCYATSILKAEMNLSFLEFKDFYVPKDCISPLDTEFLPHAAGGRMVIYKEDKMLLTVGDFSHFNIAQDDNLNFGKIISIDLKTGDTKFFSKGHRNPQGLLYLKDKDVILSTEHGPKGGDEINKIIENENYGWPIASYGIQFGHEQKKLGPVYNKHKENGFAEPIHYWNINPGIGQIIEIPENFSQSLKNHFFITSLSGSVDKDGSYKGESLYMVSFNENYDKIISMDRLYIGERIRDIIYEEELKGFLIAMENTSSIGYVRIKK